MNSSNVKNTNQQSQELWEQLCTLAGKWWGSTDLEEREQLVKFYHETMQNLYDTGWDGVMDVECMLPDKLMPQKYIERHPSYQYSSTEEFLKAWYMYPVSGSIRRRNFFSRLMSWIVDKMYGPPSGKRK